ncbi:MAG: M50 family metallopeptidase [Spirochaetia bacterium]|nr:M50 family metallopeptidase [Spirochaetia bacterium]
MIRFLILLACGLFATMTWDLPVLYPIKLLVVLVHEMWHGLTAMAFGGTIDQIHLGTEENGETVIYGLKSSYGFIASVSAGYLGSALAGSIMLNRGLAASMERFTLFVFTILLGYMTFLFTEFGSVAFYTGAGWTIILLISSGAGSIISRYVIIALGTIFVWYSLYDTFDFTGNINSTDAAYLSRYLIENGYPLFSGKDVISGANIISIVWTILIVLTVYYFLSSQIKEKKQVLITHSPPPQQNQEIKIPPELI